MAYHPPAMTSLLIRLAPVLHLTRVTTAFAAAGNVWFVILWTRSHAIERELASDRLTTLPLWLLLASGGLYALALYAFAMALNDALDVRRDRALHPDRPLPSGRLSLDTAIGLITLTLLVAILGASTLGLPAVWTALGTAGAVLIYNASVKYLPSIGLVLVALIYGAHMMAANVELIFVWPVWLAMTHMLGVGALSHLFASRRPALTKPMLASAMAGWLLWSGVLLFIGYRRAGTLWPSWVNVSTIVVPAALAVSFVVFAWMRYRRSGATPRSAEKIERYGALWLTLYTIAWMAGEGRWNEAGILAGLAVVGFLGMTVLKEMYNLAEHPVGFRR